MEYVNIMEAARRCQVSDKTIRRWIHAEKLRAHFRNRTNVKSPSPIWNRFYVDICLDIARTL